MKNSQEEPKQYPIGGYAPGNYISNCINCEEHFLGDKRAVQCEPCAIEMVEDKAETNQILKEAKENTLKQETLEDILPKNSNGKYSRNEIERAFELGANWQAERMYSEKEVFSILDKVFHMYASNHRKDAKEWFEQNKKK